MVDYNLHIPGQNMNINHLCTLKKQVFVPLLKLITAQPAASFSALWESKCTMESPDVSFPCKKGCLTDGFTSNYAKQKQNLLTRMLKDLALKMEGKSSTKEVSWVKQGKYK